MLPPNCPKTPYGVLEYLTAPRLFAGGLWLAICFLSLGFARAQTSAFAKKINQYDLQVWGNEQGLPTNTAIQILQSRDGYIWAATFGGIVRFNGKYFKVFNTKNFPEFKNNTFNCITQDAAGNIWAGSEGGGLVKIDSELKAAVYGIVDGLANTSVEKLALDKQGVLWIGGSQGLEFFDKGVFSKNGVPSELQKNTITSIYSVDDELWVCNSQNNVFCRKGKVWFASPIAGLPESKINCLAKHGKALWIGTDKGLVRRENNKTTLFTEDDSLPDNSVSALLPDGEKGLWVGTFKGLSRIARSGQIEKFDKTSPLSTAYVNSLAKDAEGNIWGTSYRAGIFKLTDGIFSTFTFNGEKEGGDIVHTALQVGKDSLLVALNDDLYALGANAIPQPLGLDKKYGLEAIKAIFIDSKKNIWICARPKLLKLSPSGKAVFYGKEEGFIEGFSRTITEGLDGSIWVGAYNGLSRIKPSGEISNYTMKEGLADNLVLALFIDSSGKVWVSTRNGISVFNNIENRLVPFHYNAQLPGNVVFKIYEDASSTIWIPCNGGLARFKDGKISAVSSKNGFGGDVVFQVLEDKNGTFWFPGSGTGSALFSLEADALNAAMQDKGFMLRPKVYSISDGLKSSESTANSSSLIDGKGRLWIATTKGLSYFDPAKAKKNKTRTPVFLEEFWVDSIQNNISEPNIKLSPGKHRILFRFSGLSYSEPEKTSYKFRLLGYESDWQTLSGGGNEAVYTSLPKGSYEFEVIAADSRGLWSEKPARLKFQVTPYFYETTVFKWGGGTLIALILVGAFYVRLWQIQARKKTLEKLVQERTVQIETQKEEILQKNKEMQKGQAEMFSANQILQQKNEEIILQGDQIKHKNIELKRAVSEIQLQKMQLENQKNALESAKTEVAKKNTELTELNHILESKVQKRTDQLNKAYKALRVSHQELDYFIYRAAHDLRGPIARLLGLTILAKMEMGDPPPAFVSLMQSTAKEMESMLLRLTETLETKTTQPNLGITDISELICAEMEAIKAQNEHIAFELKVGEAIKGKTDAKLLKTLLQNLLDNAVKFQSTTNDRPFVKITAFKDKGMLQINVSDNGIGVQEEVRPKIFDMFFVGNDMVKGSGLGLYQAAIIAEKLKGSLELLFSGRGLTVFQIKIPIV